MNAGRALQNVHAAIALPITAAAAIGLALPHVGGLDRQTSQLVVAGGASIGALAWAATLALRHWSHVRARRPLAPRGSTTGSVVALLAGASVGAFSGAFEEAQPAGLHLGAAVGYFALLPVLLLACCLRTPRWRSFVDVILVMTGVEVAGQLTYSWTKWGRLHWWDDITGIDLAYLLGGLLAASVALGWQSWRPQRGTYAGGEVPPPVRAVDG